MASDFNHIFFFEKKKVFKSRSVLVLKLTGYVLMYHLLIPLVRFRFIVVLNLSDLIGKKTVVLGIL